MLLSPVSSLDLELSVAGARARAIRGQTRRRNKTLYLLIYVDLAWALHMWLAWGVAL